MHVGLDENRQFLDVLVFLGLGHELFQRRAGTGTGAFFLGLFLAVLGYFAGLRLGLDDVENVARLGRAVEAQHLDRDRRPGLVHALAAVVDERTHLAPLLADDENVAPVQGSLADQNRSHRTAADIELGLDHGAFGGTVGVGLEFHDLGLQRDRFQQLVKALAQSWR